MDRGREVERERGGKGERDRKRIRFRSWQSTVQRHGLECAPSGSSHQLDDATALLSSRNMMRPARIKRHPGLAGFGRSRPHRTTGNNPWSISSSCRRSRPRSAVKQGPRTARVSRNCAARFCIFPAPHTSARGWGCGSAPKCASPSTPATIPPQAADTIISIDSIIKYPSALPVVPVCKGY